MDGYAIVKIEADKEDIVSEFNSYMQRKEHSLSFISGSEGYFRLEYGANGASSTAIEAFGSFLQSSGYSISAIGSSSTREGQEGTVFSFSKNGAGAHAVLSTVNIC